MAMLHGRGGSVTFTGGDFTEVFNWSVEVTADFVQSTGMDAATYYRDYEPGFRGWRATVETIRSTKNIGKLDDYGTLALSDGTLTFGSGALAALLVEVHTRAERDDVVKETLVFVGAVDLLCTYA